MDTPDTGKHTVRVSIFNQTYTISTSENPQTVQDLATEIDELMMSIARHAGNLDSTRTAVLACLQLADRLRITENELAALRQSVTHKTRDFAMLLDQAISILPRNSEGE